MRLEEVEWPELGRSLYARPGTSDRRVIEDCFTGRYHLPPEAIDPGYVLDLGANIGATAAHYRHLWPTAVIVAVEIDPWSAFVGERNAPDVQWRHEAVAATPGLVTYGGDEAESYRIDGGDQYAQAFTLSQMIARAFGANPAGVDFVKADIESAEWGLLASDDGWDRVRRLLVELHPYGAPDPPPGPWPAGRDGPSALLAAAIPRLEALGFKAEPHRIHPAAVWAVRE